MEGATRTTSQKATSYAELASNINLLKHLTDESAAEPVRRRIVHTGDEQKSKQTTLRNQIINN